MALPNDLKSPGGQEELSQLVVATAASASLLPPATRKKRFFAARLGIDDHYEATEGSSDSTSETDPVDIHAPASTCLPPAILGDDSWLLGLLQSTLDPSPLCSLNSQKSSLDRSESRELFPSIAAALENLRRNPEASQLNAAGPAGPTPPLPPATGGQCGHSQAPLLRFPAVRQRPTEQRPALADRLAATLHTIQGSVPARKLLKSCELPGASDHATRQHEAQLATLANSHASFLAQAISPSHSFMVVPGKSNQFPLQELPRPVPISLPFLNKTSRVGSTAQVHLPQLSPAHPRPGRLQGPWSRPAHSPAAAPQVPRQVGGSGIEDMKTLLLRVAEAVFKNDMAAFKALFQHLKPRMRRRGTGIKRTVFIVLQALKHRMEGTAAAVVKRRLHITVEVMQKIRAWYYRAMPVCTFTVVVSVRVLLQALKGHPHVHLVVFGDSFMPVLAQLIILLASASSPASAGHNMGTEEHNRCTTSQSLKSIRVTQVRAIGLARPGRTEFETLQASDAISSHAKETAESLGVEFFFHGVVLKEHSLNLLEEIRGRPGERLAVCSIAELKYFSEDLGEYGDSLIRFMLCMRRLQPPVVCMIEEDTDACGPDFMRRFVNMTDLLATAHDVHDSLVVSKDPRYVHGFEDYYWNLIAFNVIACEGSERRWRIRSFAQMAALFLSWGFKPLQFDPGTPAAAQRVLSSQSEEWGIAQSREGNRLSITWKGCVAHIASAWSLPLY